MTNAAPLPANEQDRLAALRALLVLDTDPEPVFDSIARMAADICGTPIALMSLIDDERQWFKANVGLHGITETPREIAFCAHAILDDAVFNVPDATRDTRFAGNPMVAGAPAIRLYAGAPLVLTGGQRIGTLCVIDRQPRELTSQQLAMLRSLAVVASDSLKMRRDLIDKSLSIRSEYEVALSHSQSFLYRTGRAAGVGGWEIDLASSTVTWSEETRRIHEVAPDYVPTLEGGIAFYDPAAQDSIARAVDAGMQRGEPWDLELPLVTAKGRSLWVRVVGEVEHEAGRPVRLVGAFQDVTERKRLEHRIASQTATLGLVTEAIPATVAVVDAEGRYRFVNGAFERWYGLPREQVLGLTVRDVLGELEFDRRWPWMQRAFEGEPVVFELGYSDRDSARHVSHNYIPLRLPNGELDGFVVVTQDVTQQKLESLRLLELSQRDPLTGLLNRSGFEQFLERNRLAGGGPSLALLYIDLDGFKAVNDTHGHPAGDRVLQQFGHRLTGIVRPTDAVARLGGDEFAIALAGIRDPFNAKTVADKILDAAKAPFDLNGSSVRIGASVGIAFNTDADHGWQDLVERADAKLLCAKAAGKGQQHGIVA